MTKGTAAPVVALIFLVCALLWSRRRLAEDSAIQLRRIPGIAAIDEALGRCTEMGRPAHYCFGVGPLDADMLASFQVLNYVARRCAENDCQLLVSVALPEVQPMVEEIVFRAHKTAGKPESYKPDYIRYLTNQQSMFSAALYGIFGREKPAANIMLGPFYAEALLVAEVGHTSGAMQIAGTGKSAQVPFFVAACDYALIGDEFFAAGAFLSRQPNELAAVLLLDMCKIATVGLIIAGVALRTFEVTWLTDLLSR